jgi:dihydrofolate reductase
MTTIYYTGCTLDGFIATPEHSLDWLTSRDVDADGPMGFSEFDRRIGACVMGANTWQWLLDHDESWGGTPAWVMTHRDFEVPDASVTFTDGSVEDVHAAMTARAGDQDLWVVGGGGLAVQFLEAGLLDEVWLQYAPVSVGAGHPVLPAHVELSLLEVARNRDFMCGRYAVVRD